MNKQLKTKGGKVISRGIEWTDYTWNPVAGCHHDCRWQMPDGSEAICYANSVATRIGGAAYPNGFAHHYWHPERLNEPYGLNTKAMRQEMPGPPKIFLDSMSDLMGNWVPKEQIENVFATCRNTPFLIYQLLTKNAPRLLQFSFPNNVWIGVSAPPSFINGKELTLDQQRSMVFKQLDVLREVRHRNVLQKTWMSIEPLSFDIADVFEHWTHSRNTHLPLAWSVIGAASNGSKLYQPAPEHVENCHRVLRHNGVNIFHKGNLDWNPHLEEWPV